MSASERRPLTRKARAEQTRQHILDVALEKFAQQPYDEVSVADLARSAGVAYGLLFHHFSNKRSLYLETMREVARQLNAQHMAASPVEEQSTPGEQLHGMWVRHLTYMAEHPDLAQSIISGGIGADSEAREIFDADRRKIAQWWLGLVNLDPDNPALYITTQATVAAVDTATLRWIEGGCQFDTDDMAEMMLDLMINALWSAQRLDPTMNVAKAVRLLRPGSARRSVLAGAPASATSSAQATRRTRRTPQGFSPRPR